MLARARLCRPCLPCVRTSARVCRVCVRSPASPRPCASVPKSDRSLLCDKRCTAQTRADDNAIDEAIRVPGPLTPQYKIIYNTYIILLYSTHHIYMRIRTVLSAWAILATVATVAAAAAAAAAVWSRRVF